MKIITVNLPSSYIEDMEPLTGNESLYPSRSELIRVAVRDFLLKNIRMAENKKQELEMRKKPQIIISKNEDFEMVSIPVQLTSEISSAASQYKSYKIIKK
jgi:Arc/MetJ-type ribon-helix-helix transcriptional regulator